MKLPASLLAPYSERFFFPSRQRDGGKASLRARPRHAEDQPTSNRGETTPPPATARVRPYSLGGGLEAKNILFWGPTVICLRRLGDGRRRLCRRLRLRLRRHMRSPGGRRRRRDHAV